MRYSSDAIQTLLLSLLCTEGLSRDAHRYPFPLVFNVGEYRRDAVKFFADKDFFDPDNAGAVAVRK